MDASPLAPILLSPARALDFEALLDLRLDAMRESLERIGRYNAQRSRERFQASFDPAVTWWISFGGAQVGFVAVRFVERAFELDHLYVRPTHQSRGIGARVLRSLCEHADAQSLPTQVGALRESASNRFYQRHGFVLVSESEWDLHYTRPPGAAAESLAPDRRQVSFAAPAGWPTRA